MRRIFLITTAIVGIGYAGPARADPITTAIAGSLTGLFSAATALAIATFAVNTVASMALSRLAMALRSKPRPPGLKQDWTARGGVISADGILGLYATPGAWVTPPMSHGKLGKTPNAYLTYVHSIADLPGHSHSGRIMVNGEYVAIGQDTHPEFGHKLLGKYDDQAWIRWHDGTQTTADARLIEQYGDYPNRPWTGRMIGHGVAYAVLTWKHSRELHRNALPEVTYEVQGLPLYDPRLDSSMGGSGPQRWGDRTTWASSSNPIVMIYNILRGAIALPDGAVWGGGAQADDLPLASWAAAMNICDEMVPLQGGAMEPRYRAGIKIDFAEDEPADVIDELLKTCSGAIAGIGGVYRIRAGGVGLPVFFLTDEMILRDHPEVFHPFPGLAASHNAVHAQYPSPDQLWRAQDATPFYNPAWEAEDDGRRLIADLALPACPFPLQVQRLIREYAQDGRRLRRHDLVLDFYAAALEPLDVIAWTSAQHGYSSKAFEIDQVSQQARTLVTSLALREVDPDDFDPPLHDLPADPGAPGWALPPVQAVPGWAVEAHGVLDAHSTTRRPALRLSWDAEAFDDVQLLRVRVRLAGDPGNGWSIAINDVEAGAAIVTEGILPGGSYEARARLVTDRPNEWSSWLGATVPDARLSDLDITPGGVGAASLSAGIKDSIAGAVQEAEDALAAAGAVEVNLAQTALTLRQDFAAADGIIAGQITGLTTRMGDAEADIATAQQIASGADQAIATMNSTIGATFGSLAAWVGQSFTAMADQNGFAAAYAGIVAETANGHIAGFKATSWNDPDGTGGSVLQLLGDQVILPGTLSVGSLLSHDGTGNLAIDAGTWRSGDGRGIPAGSAFEVIARGALPDAAALNAPTPFVLLAQAGHSSNTDRVEIVPRLATRAGQRIAWGFDLAGQGESPNARWQLLFQWSGADGTASTEVATETATAVGWETRSGTVTCPRDGELLVELRRLGDAANPQQGRSYITNLDIRRQVGAVSAIAPGSITSLLIEAGSMSADDLQAGVMNARHLEVTEQLSLDGEHAGFAMGKTAVDDATDGVYFGREGAAGFGLAASRVNPGNGRLQALVMSGSAGLQLTNSRFRVEANVVSPAVSYTTARYVDLTQGEGRTVRVQLIGGGGAGGGAGPAVGISGTDTVIRLWSGSDNLASWTAAGGLAGNHASSTRMLKVGASSPWGAGGAAGVTRSELLYADKGGGTWTTVTHPGGAGTGFGSGGGGAIGEDIFGGQAGSIVDTGVIDLTGMPDPRIEIVSVGSGGARSTAPGSTRRGGNGAPGRVLLQEGLDAAIPANVLPLRPTAHGTLDKSGVLTAFPDLGPGLWVLSSRSDVGLGMGTYRIGPEQTVWIYYNRTYTIISDRTPVQVVNGSTASRTIDYLFYSMEDWG